MAKRSDKFPYLLVCVLLATAAPATNPPGEWRVEDRENPELPGRRMDVLEGNRPAASLIYGEGQARVYLHVYGLQGELLTNSGLNPKGEEIGLYPHHRGIFIGWNQIQSELGRDNLWAGPGIVLDRFDPPSTNFHSATLVAFNRWLSSRTDPAGSNLLLTERRKIIVSRPQGNYTQIDTEFTLQAARDLELGGDLHHAGIHFRAANEVAERNRETAYLWEPNAPGEGGQIVHSRHRWVQFLFPIGPNWYTVTQLNAPANPTEELSWRDYGRFGYFFKKTLRKDEKLTVNYRFIVEAFSDPETALDRSRAEAHYREYAGTR